MNGLLRPLSLALMLLSMGLAACSSTSPAAVPTIRGSAQTAPADLQLLCAGEAQTRFAAPPNSVLPVASRPGMATGTYSVDLKLPTGQALCVIDANGAISSLERT
ncbi:MAG: hypothetical protein WBA73_12305 [Devosia sp.]